jgi:hypothetical protein
MCWRNASGIRRRSLILRECEGGEVGVCLDSGGLYEVLSVVPDGIVSHLVRECGGNVHEKGVVGVITGSFKCTTVSALYVVANVAVMAEHTVLLSRVLVAFRVRESIVSYRWSKFVIEVNEFCDSRIWENRNVNIAISSMKIKVIPTNYWQYHVICSEFRVFSISFISKDDLSGVWLFFGVRIPFE